VILLLIGYLALAWASGFGLTFVSRLPWELEGRLAMGLPVGFGAAAMLTWLVAIPFGMSGYAVAAGALALAVVLVACARWTDWQEQLASEAVAMARRWRGPQSLPLALLLVLGGLFFIPFYAHALEMRADGLYAGYVNIWGDWCTHLSMSGYLSGARHLLPPQNPFFSGFRLTYPFLPDLFSGMLLYLGMSLTGSMPLTSAILSLALVVVFFSTAVRLVGNRWAAAIGTMVFFLSGGLGFANLLSDAHPVGAGPVGWLRGLLGAIAHPVREYTLDRAVGLQWLNPVLAYLVPQRTTLFGFSLGLLVLSLLWYGRSRKDRRETFLAGIVLGLMPLLHVATYFDLLLLTGGLAAIDIGVGGFARARWDVAFKRWLAFFTPALALGVPQLLLILPPVAYGPSFLRIQLGWLSDGASVSYHLPFLTFWLLNTSLLIPLALAAFFSTRWGKPGLRRFLLPAWLLFLIPNLVILQPWDWDNTKWFVWWAILASMLAGLVFYQLIRRGSALAVLGLVMLSITVFSGSLDLIRASQKDLPNVSFRLLDNDELAVADWAQAQTPPDAVFLTGWKNNHPILTLSRRAEVMGYPGWLWTWGLPYPDQRQGDVVAMYKGGADSQDLLKRYQVRYVVIGPQELTEVGANVPYYQSRYPMVYQSPHGEYEVFRVG
jgi:hypothetical protein